MAELLRSIAMSLVCLADLRSVGGLRGRSGDVLASMLAGVGRGLVVPGRRWLVESLCSGGVGWLGVSESMGDP